MSAFNGCEQNLSATLDNVLVVMHCSVLQLKKRFRDTMQSMQWVWKARKNDNSLPTLCVLVLGYLKLCSSVSRTIG